MDGQPTDLYGTLTFISEDTLPTHVSIAIVGAGFGGIGMAIRLRQEGIDDFVVLDRGDDVGGTWRDNTYPGCQCDIPSHLYSFSFAPNPNWSRKWAPQAVTTSAMVVGRGKPSC